ncbi:hypothetical protein HOK51_07980 [Candidatus Woesearchaeota archaeon]|nr:hypothetical protein [Candidatus Woesearchaeota archaeon]MBT6519764.1 hypothetical protein [Candidatus Woesearchaeota archaeon]MBT7368143.1 hypothetical protein [Candidatus Woesearchaeota archaeon]
MNNVTELSLKKLKGIKPKGIKTKSNSKLENLIDLSWHTIDKFKTHHHVKDNGDDACSALYRSFYKYAKKRFDHEFIINQFDLETFIYSNCNKELPEVESKLFGFFTSSLLDYLTEKNKEKGLNTRVYLNGQGNEFNDLFTHAQNVDELILDNFTGKKICRRIASRQGRANRIVLMNFKNMEDYVCAGATLGSPTRKTIKEFWLINNSRSHYGSYDDLSNIADAEEIWLVNNEISCLEFDLGSAARRVWFLNNKFTNPRHRFSVGYQVNSIFLFNKYPKNKIKFDKCMDVGISPKIKDLVIHYGNAKGSRQTQVEIKNLEIKNLVHNQDARNQYNEIIQIANTMKNNSLEEIENKIKKIKELYNN